MEQDLIELKIEICKEIDVILEHGHGEIVIKIDDKRIHWKSGKERLTKLID